MLSRPCTRGRFLPLAGCCVGSPFRGRILAVSNCLLVKDRVLAGVSGRSRPDLAGMGDGSMVVWRVKGGDLLWRGGGKVWIEFVTGWNCACG